MWSVYQMLIYSPHCGSGTHHLCLLLKWWAPGDNCMRTVQGAMESPCGLHTAHTNSVHMHEMIPTQSSELKLKARTLFCIALIYHLQLSFQFEGFFFLRNIYGSLLNMKCEKLLSLFVFLLLHACIMIIYQKLFIPILTKMCY